MLHHHNNNDIIYTIFHNIVRVKLVKQQRSNNVRPLVSTLYVAMGLVLYFTTKLSRCRAQDPMDACYLANNRASESLTISESTPIGSVVGELSVNGDSGPRGDIELSVRMPTNNNLKSKINFDLKTTTSPTSSSSSSSSLSKHNFDSDYVDLNRRQQQQQQQLSQLIELMPPLTIERDSKRLILVKKLDRERLDEEYQQQQQHHHHHSISSSSSSTSTQSTGSLTVHVKCQLRRDPENSILIPIHLIVTDANDNWPSFLNAPYIVDVNESAPIGTFLGQQTNEIVAVDADQPGPLSTIEYSIMTGNLYSDAFAFLNPLDARSLIVRDSHLLDFESQPKFSLRIMAKDQGEPANWAVSVLHVNLIDIDDMNPQFQDDEYFALIRFNKPGELIELGPKRLQARDGDRSIQTPINYAFHIKTNQSAHFELDSESGRLSLRKSLPDQQEPFCLVIRASQQDDHHKQSLAAIQIQLSPSKLNLDIANLRNNNNNSSNHWRATKERVRFVSSNFTLELSEWTQVGTVLMTAQSLFGNSFTKSISSSAEMGQLEILEDDSGYIKWDSQSKELKLNRQLDYEIYKQVSIKMLLISSSSQSNEFQGLTCETSRLTINVQDQNDFGPEFSHQIYHFSISIADLIAASGQQQTNGQRNDKNNVDTSSSQSFVDESLGIPSSYLGTIYCSDRDTSDKVSLELTGSKSSLFRLTNDGRLYLPLVNASLYGKYSFSGSIENGNTIKLPRLSGSWFSKPRQTTSSSNQFDSDSDSNSASDIISEQRQHWLTYLLSQFSNLARLRLKIIAKDDGKPTILQSEALVVISIVSIDNFIIQQSSHLKDDFRVDQFDGKNNSGIRPLQESERNTDSNYVNNNKRFDQKSIEWSGQQKNTSNQHHHRQQPQQQQQQQQQLMMISTKNGRSFVHLGADLISNIIKGPTTDLNNDHSNNISRISKDFNPTLTSESIHRPQFALSQSQIEREQGDTMNIQSGQTGKIAPSLLLVGADDIPKFVYLPSAVEKVVQEHVQLEREHVLSSSLNGRLGQHHLNRSPQNDINYNSDWFSWSTDMDPLHQSVASWCALFLQLAVVVALSMLAIKLLLIAARYRSQRSNHLNGYLPTSAGCGPGSESFGSRSQTNDAHWFGRVPSFLSNSFKNNKLTSSTTNSSTPSNFNHRSLQFDNMNANQMATKVPGHDSNSFAFQLKSSSSSSSSSSCNKVLTNGLGQLHEQVQVIENSSSANIGSCEQVSISNSKSEHQHQNQHQTRHVRNDHDGETHDNANDNNIIKSSTFVGAVNNNMQQRCNESMASQSVNEDELSLKSSSLTNISNSINEAVRARSHVDTTESSLSSGSLQSNNICKSNPIKVDQARPLPSLPSVGLSQRLRQQEHGFQKNAIRNIPKCSNSPSPSLSRPQNPIHLKLRQQLSPRSQQQSTTDRILMGKSRLGARHELLVGSRPVAPPTPPPPPPIAQQQKQKQHQHQQQQQPSTSLANQAPRIQDNIIRSEQTKTTSASTPVAATKVSSGKQSISPSISVDRGYESLQINGMRNKKTGIKEKIGSDPLKAPPPPPPPASSDCSSLKSENRATINCSAHTSSHALDDSNTTIARTKTKAPPTTTTTTTTSSSNSSSNRHDRHRTRQAIERLEAKTSSASRPFNSSVPSGPRILSLKESMTSNDMKHEHLNASSKQNHRHNRYQIVHNQRAKIRSSNGRLTNGSNLKCKQISGDETEDEEFHYGRNHLNPIAKVNVPITCHKSNGNSALVAANLLLANYASHQYPFDEQEFQYEPSHSQLDRLEYELRQMTKLAESEHHRQQAKQNDYRQIYDYRPNASENHLAIDQTSYAIDAGRASIARHNEQLSKKQLTWSDQVDTRLKSNHININKPHSGIC